MSLPWRKTVRLRVVPGAVCGTLEHGLRARVLASAHRETHSAAAARIDTASPPVGPAGNALALGIDAVLAELAETASVKGARLEVGLADALLHIDIATGDFRGESDRQLQTIAAACAAELLGDAAQAHEIRWQLQRGGTHLLIAAIARDLLGAFTEAAARHALALKSVQPDFCLQWNRHARALKPGSGVFVVACGTEALVAHVSDGAVAALSSGTWLDRQNGPGFSQPHVTRLMCEVGLQPEATTRALDARVDRLLASIGRTATDQSAYVLVAPALADKAVSSRWTVLAREAQPQ